MVNVEKTSKQHQTNIKHTSKKHRKNIKKHTNNIKTTSHTRLANSDYTLVLRRWPGLRWTVESGPFPAPTHISGLVRSPKAPPVALWRTLNQMRCDGRLRGRQAAAAPAAAATAACSNPKQQQQEQQQQQQQHHHHQQRSSSNTNLNFEAISLNWQDRFVDTAETAGQEFDEHGFGAPRAEATTSAGDI